MSSNVQFADTRWRSATGLIAPSTANSQRTRSCAARVAVGDDAGHDLAAGVGPGGDRARHPEIDVVRMSRDDQDPPNPASARICQS